MLYEESIWIGNELNNFCKEGDKILNIGSSNLSLRTEIQPHMEKFIFEPLSEKGIKVTHTDLKDDEGVDIVGDLTDEIFIKKLKNEKYNLIICSNLLEHLTDKQLIVNSIFEILPTNGKAIITVPFNYPYHLDPIDTMYRPNIKNLEKLFSKLKLVKGEIVEGSSFRKNTFQNNYWEQLISQPYFLFINVLRLFLPFYKYKVWKITLNCLLKAKKQFSATCVILQK